MKCDVCGRTATGVHYGVPACEGCKAFYRRGVENNITYLCYFGNKCVTNTNTRSCCKACRFQKCVSLGMKIYGSRIKSDRQNEKPSKKLIDNKNKNKKEISAKKSGRSSISSVKANIEAASDESANLQEFTITSNTTEDEQPSPFPDSTLTLPGDIDWTDILFTETGTPKGSENNETVASELGLSLETTKNRHFETRQPLGNEPRRLVNFMNHYAEILDENRRQMALTVQSVTIAVEVVFRDQISQWKTCMDRAINHDEVMYQPETTLQFLMKSLQFHNEDSVVKTQTFAKMLPGITEMDGDASNGKITIGWKWFAFWMLHHSPFLKNGESYVTIGTQQIRYSRYWQDLLFERPLTAFIYKFCAEFNDIGLTETETYLLLAVIMFEPVGESRNHSLTKNLTLIHRHYTDVLFDLIKRRCSENFHLVSTCRKLERFFSAVKFIHRLHRHYFRVLDMSQAPFRAVKGNRPVSVLDALCFNDKKDTIEELEPEFRCIKRVVEV